MEALEDRVTPSTFLVNNVNDSGTGSLRQAILNANSNPGHDTIRFSIAIGMGRPIRPINSLPDITSPVTVDGNNFFNGFVRLPNFSGRPLIEIDGSLADPNLADPRLSPDGLRLQPGSQGSLIRGLVINRFNDAGIVVAANNITIQNCWIGLTFDGNGDAGNGNAGIHLVNSASDCLVGGNQAGQHNVISGNAAGILLSDGVMVNNTIQANLIGINVEATAAVPNIDGIILSSSARDTEISTNLISGNSVRGILLQGVGTTGTRIIGNRMGIVFTPLPNGSFGIEVRDGAHDNFIGDLEPDNGNLIAFSGDKGVFIGPTGGTGNRILGNSIFGSFNTIFVSADGVNFPAQDALDADTGPNDLQNFPDLTSATRSADGTTMTVVGGLSSKPNRSYRIEVFVIDSDRVVSGIIGDLTLVGILGVNTNSSGLAAFNSVIPLPPILFPFGVPANLRVLATATDLTTGDTSNNSVNIAATSLPMVKNDTLTPLINEGELATLSGQLVDSDPTDFLTLRVNWGDGSKPQSYHPGTDPFAVTHQYVENGTYNVTYEWFAQVGGVKSRTKQVTVLNAAPEMVTAQITPVAPRYGVFLLTGLASDAGLRDRLLVTVSWGDGKTDTVNLGRLRTFALVHRFVEPGNYEVTVTVTDDDGDSSSALTLTVDATV